jgi:hypothetical protein
MPVKKATATATNRKAIATATNRKATATATNRKATATATNRKAIATATNRKAIATATKRKATATAKATARAIKRTAKLFIIPLAHTVSPTTPMNTSNYSYTATQGQYKTFIEDLNKIFTNEKIIDRDDKAGFKELIAEQRPYNKLLYKINPKNIVCFIVCDYYGESQVSNKYNNNGNVEFNELLRKNNMGMIWLNYNTLYIYLYI